MFHRFATCLALSVLTAAGALAETRSFEVVSIKAAEFPSDAYRAGFLQGYGECGSTKPAISGNRVIWRIISACGIVRFAYDLPEYGVAGAPDWMTKKEQSVFYTVEAKAAAESVTLEEAREMFRAVLAERFALQFHRETRPLPVYGLVVAKGGHKLKPPCASQTTSVARIGVDGPAVGLREARLAGIESCKQTVAQLVAHLTRSVDRSVIDNTGLKGEYSIKLSWSADGNPTIWTAVQEQLGLKLEPSRSPVEVLVIDHAEKPSAN